MKTPSLRAIVASAALAATPLAAGTIDDRVATELARGACTAAASAAERAQATARGDAGLADALALRTRVALDCMRPQTPGLDEWLAQERELRTRAGRASPNLR